MWAEFYKGHFRSESKKCDLLKYRKISEWMLVSFNFQQNLRVSLLKHADVRVDNAWEQTIWYILNTKCISENI